jgi:HPt (histidine-containing phosphotransfer) domain-containing protein
MADEGSSVLNGKILADLRTLEAQGSPGFLAELIDVFFREFARHLKGLHAAMQSQDAREVERVAHTMKGSSGNLGAEALSRVCAALQNAAHAADWAVMRDLVPKVEAEYERARRELLIERDRKP